ncbi:MAG: putative Ferredoxin--NAD(+) reductase [Microgenomates group bacterium Gr01-1014_16]|nr:MAG: putative Ferredoxin--NAD(+) reductase [Microgenomates group bacterium Gr01-1014_16]
MIKMLVFMPNFKKHIGHWTIVFLTIIPVGIWLKLHIGLPSFWSARSLSQIFGLAGSVLLSLNFVLALRSKKLEPYFGGLNRIYILHHQTGAYAFVLLLFHPVAMILDYLRLSVVSAAQLIVPSIGNIPVSLGILALWLMIILLVLTFYVNLPYQIWKFTHQWLGLTLLLATLHVYSIPSDVAVYMPLRVYILVLSALGLAAYIYRTLLGRWLVKKTSYTVHSVEVLNNQVSKILLEPVKKPISFHAGRFIFIDVKSLGISRESHPFSLISDPDSSQLQIAAKSSGDYTETLKLLKVGSSVRIEGPFGGFLYQQSRYKSQIWIAGGIGITPFLSMSADLAHHPGYQAALYYVVSTPDEALFSPRNVQLHVHISKTQGRLTAETVAKDYLDFKSRDIFICGPPPMMTSLRSQFNKLGVKNSRIHTEEFSLQ